jgi:hypothetical protein
VSFAEQPQVVHQQPEPQQQQQQQIVSLQQPPSVLQQVSISSSGQQQRLLQLPPVPVPPPQYSSTDEPLPPALIEVLLHKPTIRAPHQFEDGYIWQDIVMVSRQSCGGVVRRCLCQKKVGLLCMCVCGGGGFATCCLCWVVPPPNTTLKVFTTGHLCSRNVGVPRSP